MIKLMNFDIIVDDTKGVKTRRGYKWKLKGAQQRPPLMVNLRGIKASCCGLLNMNMMMESWHVLIPIFLLRSI